MRAAVPESGHVLLLQLPQVNQLPLGSVQVVTGVQSASATPGKARSARAGMPSRIALFHEHFAAAFEVYFVFMFISVPRTLETGQMKHLRNSTIGTSPYRTE